jgi:hypothetical protein
MEVEPIVVQCKGCAGRKNPKKWKWAKEMTSFYSNLGSTLILDEILHPNMLASSRITALHRIWSNAL